MKLIIVLLLLLIFPGWITIAQEKASAVKLAEYDHKTDSLSEILAKIEVAANQLKADQGKSKLFVAMYWRLPLESALKLRTSAREIINKIGLKSDQFHITHPQISYWPEILATEVWLVPAKAQMPYKAVTADCAYWKPEIKGMLDVDVRTERLFFSTEKIGWWPESLVVYKWSVNGGVIEDGASTTKIVVRPSNGNKTGVTVKLKLDLIEDMCMIENTTMFETRFRPR